MADNYEIGYGKPPKKSRFREGQSGNPKGRPRKKIRAAADVAAILDEPIAVRKAGVTQKMTAAELSVRQLVKRALKKDPSAIRELLKLWKRYGLITPPPPAQAHSGVLRIPKGIDRDKWLKEHFGFVWPTCPTSYELGFCEDAGAHLKGG